MMAADTPLLIATLRDPERAAGYGLRDWEHLVWQARAAELMAQLHHVLQQAGQLAQAPAAARRHLDLAWRIAVHHTEAVSAELQDLQEALEPLGVPVLLLKGSAYQTLQHPAAIGRIFNDIDILVPKAALPEVEQRLSWAGWLPQHTDAYDERYYREWMHEIPPLEHKYRGTVLDVHFTILPPTSGIRPDPARLFAAARPLVGNHGFFSVLCPADMVIHSSCHLFFGEFHKGLRDLYDLHQLLADFARHQPGFWGELPARAAELGLALPVLDALRQCRRVYGSEVPAAAEAELRRAARSPWPEAGREWLFEHALRPAHVSAETAGSSLAQALVFVRSHWLRMPLPLLAYHIGHKLFASR